MPERLAQDADLIGQSVYGGGELLALIYLLYGYRNSRLRMAHGAYGVLPAEPADILHQHRPPDEKDE